MLKDLNQLINSFYMLSKEEAESKLYRIFYTLEMDKTYQKSPESVEINIFETASDPEHLEHNWYFSREKNKLLVQMTAVDYEKGTQYVSGTFAFNAAWRSMKGFIFKLWGLIQLATLALIIGFEVLGFYLTTIQYYLGILPAIAICVIDFLFFYILRVRKKRIEKSYLENLNVIANEIESTSLEKYSTHFFKLFTKTFSSSALVGLISIFMLIILIGQVFT
ncbi:MAG: hypothetical protein FK732_12590 [Asgard group archaeon]|nr:hypothetical protein [Asgard group archaeon]